MRWRSALATATTLCLGLDSRWQSCDSFLVARTPPRSKQLPVVALNVLKPSKMVVYGSNQVVCDGRRPTDPSTSHTIDGWDVTAPPQPVSNYIFVKPNSDVTLSQTAGGIMLPEKRLLSIALQFSRKSHAPAADSPLSSVLFFFNFYTAIARMINRYGERS